MRVPARSLPSFPTLCDPVNYSQPGYSVHGILQARRLEWVDMPPYRGSYPPIGIEPMSLPFSCNSGWILYHWCHPLSLDQAK